MTKFSFTDNKKPKSVNQNDRKTKYVDHLQQYGYMSYAMKYTHL